MSTTASFELDKPYSAQRNGVDEITLCTQTQVTETTKANFNYILKMNLNFKVSEEILIVNAREVEKHLFFTSAATNAFANI